MANYTWNGAAGDYGDYLDPAQWTPGDVPLYGADDVATISISTGTVALSDAEPNNITLTLGRDPSTTITLDLARDPSTVGAISTLPLSYPIPRLVLPLSYPILALRNAALGPDMTLNAAGLAGLRVDGYDTNYGRINAVPFSDGQGPGNGAALIVNIGPGTLVNQEAQLNQEGTIAVTNSSLVIDGPGTLNNNGQIFIGPGSAGVFETSTIGSGTITVDHANVSLYSAASTQTVDLLGGTLGTSPTLEATIKDWNNDGQLTFALAFSVNSVQFNQTSDAGGDLQLFGAAGQVGDLHLLGTYATSDFTLAPSRSGTSLGVSGHAPLSV